MRTSFTSRDADSFSKSRHKRRSAALPTADEAPPLESPYEHKSELAVPLCKKSLELSSLLIRQKSNPLRPKLKLVKPEISISPSLSHYSGGLLDQSNSSEQAEPDTCKVYTLEIAPKFH